MWRMLIRLRIRPYLLIFINCIAVCGAQSPLYRAWEDTFPGQVPFWEKYNTGPYGVVIRGWQFSRCASEQV